MHHIWHTKSENSITMLQNGNIRRLQRHCSLSVLHTRCRSNVSIGNGINRFSVFFFFDIMLIRKFQRFLVQQICYRIRIQCVSKCVRCVIMSYISMLESSFIRWICPTMNMQLNLKFTALFYRNFARNSLNLDLFLFTFEIIFLLGRILV